MLAHLDLQSIEDIGLVTAYTPIKVILNIILFYVCYNFLIKIFAKQHIKSQMKIHLIDENQINFFKKIYLKQKLEYILMCIKEERQESNDKTENLYKLIVEYEEFIKKEQN